MKKIFCLTIFVFAVFVLFSSLYASSFDSIWTSIAIPTNTPDRVTHGAVYDPSGDKIYLLGGSPGGQAGSNVNICQEYDPVSNSWLDQALMPTAKGWIQGSVVRGKIYVIGGYSNTSEALNENLEYDITTNTWSTKASIPHQRCSTLEAVWRDSLIYVMGGTDLLVGLSNVDIYNPFNNTWTPGTDLPEPADMGDAVIINDTIYILGAFNRGRSAPWTNLVKGAINPNNPSQITWMSGPTLPDNSLNVAAAAIADKIYWLGGDAGGNTATWYYTIGSDTIYPFIPYPIVVSRTQMMARNTGNLRELYVLAGDSANNWVPPNRTYMKYTFDVGINETKPSQIFSLLFPKPNPTSGEVRIAFSLPNHGKAELVICDASGRIITKITEEKDAGNHECLWQAKDQKGKALPNGIYFVRLRAGNNLQTQKITLAR